MYDTIIIGAGMSGLAAGIRLASMSPAWTMFSSPEDPTERRSTARTRALNSSGLNGFAR